MYIQGPKAQAALLEFKRNVLKLPADKLGLPGVLTWDISEGVTALRQAMLVSIEFILFDEASRAGKLSAEEMEALVVSQAQAVAGCLNNFCCVDGKDKRPKFLAMYTAYVMSVWISTGKLVHSNRFAIAVPDADVEGVAVDLGIINPMMAKVTPAFQRANGVVPPAVVTGHAARVLAKLAAAMTSLADGSRVR